MDKTEVTQKLIQQGLKQLQNKYGPAGATPLAYHNTMHTKDVIEAAQHIGKLAVLNGQIRPEDVPLLELAACYHDIEHGLEGRQNEDESIRIITEKMQQFNVYSPDDISKVACMILATITHVTKDKFLQSATDSYLDQIMADADMSALGRDFDTYWDRSKKLYLEDNGVEFSKLQKPEQQAFITSQINFLTIHKFYTLEAREIYNQKPQNIIKLQEIAS